MSVLRTVLVSWVNGSELERSISIAKIWYPSRESSYAPAPSAPDYFPGCRNIAPSYHPSSSFQILSSLCNEGFLNKLFLAFHTLFQQCSSTALQTLTESTWQWQTAAVWGWAGREWFPSERRSNKDFERKNWSGRLCQSLGIETKSTF